MIFQTKTQKSNEISNTKMENDGANNNRNEDKVDDKGKYDDKFLIPTQTCDDINIYNDDEKMPQYNEGETKKEANKTVGVTWEDETIGNTKNKNSGGVVMGDVIEAHNRETDTTSKIDEIGDNERYEMKITASATEYEEKLNMIDDPGVIMKYRGEQMVEDTITKSTKITIEFNPSRNVKMFNVRTETMNLLNVMWQTDKAIKVVSRETGDTYGPQDKFPAENAFMKHFLVKDVETKYQTKKVYVHVSVISTEDIARIKWRPEVRNHIFNNNIWVKEDTFNSQITSTPGYFVGVHPRATHRG